MTGLLTGLWPYFDFCLCFFDLRRFRIEIYAKQVNKSIFESMPTSLRVARNLVTWHKPQNMFSVDLFGNKHTLLETGFREKSCRKQTTSLVATLYVFESTSLAQSYKG